MKRAPTSIVVSLAKKEGQGSGIRKAGRKKRRSRKKKYSVKTNLKRGFTKRVKRYESEWNHQIY